MQTYTRVIKGIDALFGAPDVHPAAHSINVCLAVYRCLLKMSKECEQSSDAKLWSYDEALHENSRQRYGSRTISYTDSGDGPMIEPLPGRNEATAASVS